MVINGFKEGAMTNLEELERQARIDRESACEILGDPQSITFNENFSRACKLGLLSIRLLQCKEENAKPTS